MDVQGDQFKTEHRRTASLGCVYHHTMRIMCNIADSTLGYVLDMTSFNSLTLVNRLLNSTCIYFLEISDICTADETAAESLIHTQYYCQAYGEFESS
jgi:hypothetical protein